MRRLFLYGCDSPMCILQRWRRSVRGGQAVTEFALVIPIFLALLFGILEVSLALKTQAAYQQAVQEATRVAAGARTGATADTLALQQLQTILATENLTKITRVTIYNATINGGFVKPPCDATSCGGFDNQHTYYTYSASLKRFVCQNSGQDAPCSACPTGSLSGCTTESYWDPLNRDTVVGQLDHIGLTVQYDYKGLTGILPLMHLSQTFVTTIEPDTYPT